MIPLYNGQENHYKKMLDLQEKLRKSEEERIRLEERFNLLVQESRNRHQACINNLRIRYVEFLEEQKARDERNNKLLGVLDKVDNSLALMTAKTERLNVLRKQYEAYLLHTYGNQQCSGSATADSGLESQRDREFSPYSVISKSAQNIQKPVFPYINPDIAPYSYRIPHLENENIAKRTTTSLSQNPSELQQKLNLKYFQNPEPASYEDINNVFKNRPFLSSHLDNSVKHANIPKLELSRAESGIRNYLTKPLGTTSSRVSDLDDYIGKIRLLHTDTLQNSEPSFEEPDLEQNTSGDLLNVSFSEDGLDSSADEVLKKHKNRLSAARLAYATQNEPRSVGQSRVSLDNGLLELRNAPRFEKKHSSVNEEDASTAYSAPVIDRFNKLEIASPLAQRDIKLPIQDRTEQPIENPIAKLSSLDESRQLIGQNPRILENKDTVLEEEPEKQKSPENNDVPDQEFKDNGDGCIEDDYDDTVDIDTWMPDDVEEQVQEVQAHDESRDRPRRKLEIIKEDEQAEEEDPDDETEVNKDIDLDRTHNLSVPDVEQVHTQKVDEGDDFQNSQNLLEESQEKQFSETLEDVNQVENSNVAYNDNNEYTNNHHYYEQNNDDLQQQQGLENSTQLQDYDQLQTEEQQKQYQYTDDPNQQYMYDPNAQYTGYENQQYMEGSYGDYVNEQYQQYDPNQTYEHDSNQEYQQYNSTSGYEGYQDNKQYEQGLSDTVIEENQYEPNQMYDYLQESQNYNEENIPQSSNAYDDNNVAVDESVEQVDNKDYSKESEQVTSPKNQAAEIHKDSIASAHESNAKDSGKKKDIIKSILDSDSESFIERNLSNTESDFDFN